MASLTDNKYAKNDRHDFAGLGVLETAKTDTLHAKCIGVWFSDRLSVAYLFKVEVWLLDMLVGVNSPPKPFLPPFVQIWHLRT